MRRSVLAPLLAAASLVGVGVVGVPLSATAAAPGCAANAGTIPATATKAVIPDVDGDGKRDTEFFTEALPGGGYDYGIRTASGHVSRIHEDLIGPGSHGGWTARIVHGTVVTVIDDGRTAELYSFRSCGFHPVKNAQGHQYTFSIAGYGGSGTGVACVVRDGQPWLFGERAARRSDDRYDVTRTHVVVASGGASARNGVVEKVGSRLAFASSTVQTAFRSSCGSVTRVHTSGN